MKTILALAFVCIFQFLGGVREDNFRSSYFNIMPDHRLAGHLITSTHAASELSCVYKCLAQHGCKSCNYKIGGEKSCELNSRDLQSQIYDPALLHDKDFVFISMENVYCHVTHNHGWTLIARFSNNDTKSWMRDDGHWWYDQRSPQGDPTNPVTNKDMISPAFWSVTGTDFKITRSDDPTHTALLVTTGGCLGGQTFRSKVTSYGNFRSSAVWASNKCLGSCSVQYGGQYRSTHGFEQAACNGEIQSSNKIGFWCDWSTGDGAVMMIGGGGGASRKCSRADHGIGITEADAASFKEQGGAETEYDFGYNAMRGSKPSSSYSLNLWIR